MTSAASARNCAICGGEFRHWKNATCSKGCRRVFLGQRRSAIFTPDRIFWARVEKMSSCWVWTGQRNKDGYGKMTVRKRTVTSHRYSWELHHGPIPDGLWVLHSCDNPPCVNPDHLFLGNALDNRNDAVRKGRLVMHGERNPKAKLTEGDVLEIRKRLAQGESGLSLAGTFGLDASTVYAIRNGESWSHLRRAS